MWWLRRNHTTNPIDVKIEPQIALIAENFSDSFFVVILAFKGQFPNVFSQWFVINLPVHARLSPCAIESRTQENHEELKIFLPKHFISSRLIKSYIFVKENIDL